MYKITFESEKYITIWHYTQSHITISTHNLREYVLLQVWDMSERTRDDCYFLFEYSVYLYVYRCFINYSIRRLQCPIASSCSLFQPRLWSLFYTPTRDMRLIAKCRYNRCQMTSDDPHSCSSGRKYFFGS
jgi:hypothetical protein